jgi:hypothetical protein
MANKAPETAQQRPPRYRPKLNALQRYQRGRTIAEMRSRLPRPVPWREVAKHVEMTQKGAQEAYYAFLEMELPEHDPMAPVDETLDVMTVALHELMANAEAAETGSTVRVQSWKSAVDIAVTRLQVMQRAGRAPRSLAGPQMARQLQRVLTEFAELLRRHQVGDAVLRDFLALAERSMENATAIEGHALESGD